MPRHVLQPLPRAFAGHRDPSARRHELSHDEGVWERMDRVQVLGSTGVGHRGCVNALSWSDDGSTLLSGSDDKRICIWGTDPSSSSSALSASPHPLKLLDTIATGHRANIFSAKYLPNTSTPIIVSCAGDSVVRVFEVERLGRAELGIGMNARDELWGLDGPGVTVLRCHKDRTKRVATENSPFLFLTVSEDGTVRQHDLRRPHRCQEECPGPLFHAPMGVDLYSLSAFVCDRRMLARQTPRWSGKTVESGQVHCVRRLGLSDEAWESVSPTGEGNRMFAQERHITSVKMSPDKADEVICSFARHSTSLFSTYDSPASSSMRARSASPTLSTPNRDVLRRTHGARLSPGPFSSFPDVPSAKVGKRRHSELSSVKPRPMPHTRARTDEEEIEGDLSPPAVEIVMADILGEEPVEEMSMSIGEGVGETVLQVEEQELEMADLRDSLGDGGEDDRAGTGGGALEMAMGAAGGMSNGHLEHGGDLNGNGETDDRRELRIEIDGDIEHLHREMEEESEGDVDVFTDPSGDEEYDEYEEVDEDDFGELDGEDMADAPRSEEGVFAGVDMIMPRRSFKGARNIETVKDCNFFGARSEKVCSGSDDGHFFVWDKETGRLDGIWEGDGRVVNVMEQHPTLPLVAVSGIDDTVKMFAPTAQRPDPSYSRLHLRDTIINANTQRPRYRSSAFGRGSLLQFLASRGLVARVEGAEGEDDESEALQQCATQ